MAADFLTFQKFNDPGLANEIAEKLRLFNIPFQLEDNSHFFDPTFANNKFEPDINLKLKPNDFVKAQEALGEYYQQHLDDVDPAYYLFSFADKELIDIISKPDEWGLFDYQLAQKILKERGLEIKPELANRLKEQRIKELNRPETANTSWVYAGYIFSVLGGFIGFIIGWTLANSKKTLPDGNRVYVYTDEDRKKGKNMQIIAAGLLILAILTLLFNK